MNPNLPVGGQSDTLRAAGLQGQAGHWVQVGLGYGFTRIGQATEGTETVLDSIHRRIDLHLLKLNAMAVLETGTSIAIDVPFGHLNYVSDLQQTSTTGIGDVSLRIGQDLGRFYSTPSSSIPQVYVGMGLIAPTGEHSGHQGGSGGASWFTERPGIEEITTVTATLGRGAWFAFGDLGVSQRLASSLLLSMGTQLRVPVTESSEGIEWGEEVLSRLGISMELAGGLFAFSTTGTHAWRDTIIESHGGNSLTQVNSGGHFWSMSTGFEVRPMPGLRVRTTLRIPVANDVGGAQLTETVSSFLDVIWGMGIATSPDADPKPSEPPIQPDAAEGGSAQPSFFPVVVSGGAAFDPTDILVDGKITIIDYFADWCVPCKRLDKELAAALGDDPNVAVVKVDIVDWDTPAASVIAGVPGLPVLDIYDAEGNFVERLAKEAAFEFKKHLQHVKSPPETEQDPHH